MQQVATVNNQTLLGTSYKYSQQMGKKDLNVNINLDEAMSQREYVSPSNFC